MGKSSGIFPSLVVTPTASPISSTGEKLLYFVQNTTRKQWYHSYNFDFRKYDETWETTWEGSNGWSTNSKVESTKASNNPTQVFFIIVGTTSFTKVVMHSNSFDNSCNHQFKHLVVMIEFSFMSYKRNFLETKHICQFIWYVNDSKAYRRRLARWVQIAEKKMRREGVVYLDMKRWWWQESS